MIVGVVSDTHGRMHPRTLEALAGVGRIVHAGDVGEAAILDRLSSIAPVAAVRGNVDQGSLARALPENDIVDVDGTLLYVLHDLAALDLDPRAAGFAAVISGHTHAAKIERRNGVLYLNPGSCGPRRFRLPITLARLRVTGGRAEAEIVVLEEGTS
jgi:putative phosphoesterase